MLDLFSSEQLSAGPEEQQFPSGIRVCGFQLATISTAPLCFAAPLSHHSSVACLALWVSDFVPSVKSCSQRRAELLCCGSEEEEIAIPTPGPCTSPILSAVMSSWFCLLIQLLTHAWS